MKASSHRFGWILLPCLALWVCPAFAFAQLYTASLTGTVLDPAGEPVANVRVTAQDADRKTETLAWTDHSGRYLFRSLAPGTYSVKMEAAGFETFEIGDLAMEVNGSVSAGARLRLPVRRESVQVQTDPPSARVDDATVGLTLDRKLVNDLPLVSRNPFDLAFLAPGVSEAPGTTYGNGVSTPGFVTNFVSDGSRNAQADLLLDGVSVTNSDNNPGVQKALYVAPVEAIQEFKIPAGQFQRGIRQQRRHHRQRGDAIRHESISRRIVRIFPEQRSECQYVFRELRRARPAAPDAQRFRRDHRRADPEKPHLLLFRLQRDSRADRPDLFARRGSRHRRALRQLRRAVRPRQWRLRPSRRVLQSGRADLRSLHRKPDAQNNATGRAPIPFDNLATYVSPRNPAIPFGLGALPVRPGNLVDPVGAKLIQAFPLPNLNVGSAAYDPYHNWVANGTSPLHQESFDIKLDHHWSDRDVTNVRFSHEWDSGQNANFFGSVYDTSTQGPTKHAALAGEVSDVHTFNARTLMTVSLGYGHNWYPTEGVAASFPGFDPVKTLGMPSYIDQSGLMTPPSVWLFSAYGCNGFNGCVGGQAWSVLRFASETGHLTGAVDHISGRHEIKAGGEIRRHRLNFMQAGTPNGLFAFTSGATASGTAGAGGDALASLMIGYVDNWSRYEIPPFTATQSYQIGGFLQDTWRATPRLTLNFGLRYDVETPRTERFNQMTYFDPSAAAPISVPGLNLHGAVEFAGVNGNPRTEFDTYWGQVGPRFGFAYDLTKGTTLRGGYGIYYDPSDMGVAGNAVAGGFLGNDPVTNGVNNVPAAPWLPLEFLRNPSRSEFRPPPAAAWAQPP